MDEEVLALRQAAGGGKARAEDLDECHSGQLKKTDNKVTATLIA